MATKADLSALSHAELSDAELHSVTGGGWGDNVVHWGRHETAPPTPEQWKAWGQELAATYQANHAPDLGRPLK